MRRKSQTLWRKQLNFWKLHLQWLVVTLLKEAPLQFKLLVLLPVSHAAVFNTSVCRKACGIISVIELHAGYEMYMQALYLALNITHAAWVIITSKHTQWTSLICQNVCFLAKVIFWHKLINQHSERSKLVRGRERKNGAMLNKLIFVNAVIFWLRVKIHLLHSHTWPPSVMQDTGQTFKQLLLIVLTRPLVMGHHILCTIWIWIMFLQCGSPWTSV